MNGVEDWFYLNSQNEVILEENDFKTGFDPRERPWYELVKKKNGVCWTDVYVFTGAINEPGITVASPIKNESNDIVGVFGIDLTLSQLKKTLKETKITDHSHFYIVNNKTNEIVVASDKTDTFKSENSKFKLIKIDELEKNHLLRYMLKIDKNEKSPNN